MIDCASGNRPLTGTASRSRLEVAEARRLVESSRPAASRAGYVAGSLTAAVIVAGVFTTARLDDGPVAVTVHDVEPGSMYAVVDQIGARALWEQGSPAPASTSR